MVSNPNVNQLLDGFERESELSATVCNALGCCAVLTGVNTANLQYHRERSWKQRYPTVGGYSSISDELERWMDEIERIGRLGLRFVGDDGVATGVTLGWYLL